MTGRDHAHRAGAADRRDPREVARRAAGRPEARSSCRARTMNDLSELPPETREALEFIPADTVEDVFAAAFDGKRPARSSRGLSRGRPAGRAVERLTRAALLAAIALLFPAQAALAAAAPHRRQAPPTPPASRRRSRPGPTSGARSSCARRAGRRYAAASRHLAPLLYARTSGGRPLTRSGVYYLAVLGARRAAGRGLGRAPRRGRERDPLRPRRRPGRRDLGGRRAVRLVPRAARDTEARGRLAPDPRAPLRRLPAGVVRGASPPARS